MGDDREAELLRRERDFYVSLLELGDHEEVQPLLDSALSLALETTGSALGYVAAQRVDDEKPRWFAARGLDGERLEGVQKNISSGIIARALATGRTIQVAAAITDPRFENRPSVRRNQIEAVLCAPIGAIPVGVLYLQGRHPSPYNEENVRHLETLARHLSPLVERLLLKGPGDRTRALRERLDLAGFVGRGAAAEAVLTDVELIAPREVPVLLTGPSGTGKSLIARIIHRNSPRADEPFEEINCATIPESLIESELFGTVDGAFTGARRRKGRFAAAEGGTVFLDEVGELSVSAQAKLLQVLQDGTYYRLGHSGRHMANVRVIAATNSELAEAVEAKRFREDLLYRLQVFPVRMPSLRERPEDVPLLARHFARKAVERHGLPALKLTPAALAALQVQDWPGQVRQLANTVEAGCLRAEGDGEARVTPRHLFPDTPDIEGEAETWQAFTRRVQREYLKRILAEEDWNISATARRLDISRTHVYQLIRGFHLERDDDS